MTLSELYGLYFSGIGELIGEVTSNSMKKGMTNHLILFSVQETSLMVTRLFGWFTVTDDQNNHWVVNLMYNNKNTGLIDLSATVICKCAAKLTDKLRNFF